MIRKKSSFLTFIFSLLPGAGQMYMGFMKRGLSLMTVFFLTIFVGSWLGIGLLMLIIPIIWFYSFFDVFNLRAMPDEEFYAMEDNYILFPELSKDKVRLLKSKYRKVFAAALIIIGITILWNNIFDLFRWLLPSFAYQVLDSFGRYFPQLFIGTAIIALGIYLIRGKKIELDAMDNKPADKFNLLEDKRGNDQ